MNKSSTIWMYNFHSFIVFLFRPVYTRRCIFKNILSRISASLKYLASLLRRSNHVRIRYSGKVLASSSAGTSVIGLFHAGCIFPFLFPQHVLLLLPARRGESGDNGNSHFVCMHYKERSTTWDYERICIGSRCHRRPRRL